MKPIQTKQELLNIPVKSRIVTENQIMFLDNESQFHWYKYLNLDRYIDIDFVIYCKRNKIKLF